MAEVPLPAPLAPRARTAGAIYDLGYQRYTGPRFGRAHAMRSLFRFSFNGAFGIGRGEKAKSMPALVILAVYLPAVVQTALASVMGPAAMLTYAGYLQFTAFLLALFAASQAPELIVADKQHGVLSLYLSRPLKATDYVLAKLAALTAAMLVITLGPQLVLFIGKIMIAKAPWAAFQGEWTKIFPILGGTLLTSLFVASIGLLLASFASRRGYASAAVIAFFILTPAVIEMFRSVTTGSVRRYAVLAHPVLLITGFATWLFDIQTAKRSTVARADLPGQLYMYVMLAVCLVCVAVLLRRYQRIEA
jgi:ABC-2 type transport system permease protein